MKKLVVLLFFDCLHQKTMAQRDTVPFKSPEEQAKVNKVDPRRTSGLAFSNQTLNYSPAVMLARPISTWDHQKHGIYSRQISFLNLLFQAAGYPLPYILWQDIW